MHGKLLTRGLSHLALFRLAPSRLVPSHLFLTHLSLTNLALAMALLAVMACSVEKPVLVKKAPVPPPPPPTWARTFGGAKNDQASMAVSVAGGGFLMVGRTFSKGAGASDGWVLRLGPLGKVLWERTFGGKGVDAFTTVTPASGGGFMVAGVTTTNTKGRADGWVLRLDAQGNKLWEKTFGGRHNDAINASAPMPGGGTLMAGFTRSSGNGHRDAWMLWVSDDGKQSWERTEGGGKREELSSIAPVPGGGFITAGITKSFGAGDADAWVHRLDNEGRKTLWKVTFGDRAWNAVQSVSPLPDGGFILAGNTRSNSSRKSDVWVLRIDNQGKKLWEHAFGGAKIDYATSVQPLANGGFLVGGVTRSFGAGGFDAWLLGLDAQGVRVWERTFGNSRNDGFTSIFPAPDGGFIASGFSEKPGSKEDFDGWVLLLDKDGKVAEKDTEKPVPAAR